jgi:rhodanese-related sulfurtransferase
MNNSISVHDAQGLINEQNSHCILLDVRSPSEYRSVHAKSAINIPLENISSSDTIEQLKNKKVICICQSGSRGKKAVETLSSLGITNVTNVEGGTTAWVNSNLPITKGERSISMERQVRITAGAIVLLGALAAAILSTYFIIIPIFVGSGLLYSGITDTCGMALILSRCPWNKN